MSRLQLGLGVTRQLGRRRGPPWLIPTSDGQLVSCYEPTEAVYRAAADALGIAEAVQDIAWAEALLGGSRLFIPQSLATGVVSGVARCELGMDPAATINFDNSLAACQAMGAGWTLMTQAQWHVLMVISQAYWDGQGKTDPTGNTQYGRSGQVTAEVGIRADGLTVTGSGQGTYGRTLTGLRAVADGGGLMLPWSHDGSSTGVFDLVGNVWEWSSRMRLNEGRIEVIPASAGIQVDHGASSTAWRAIRPDGTLVALDAGGDMLHYDATTSSIVIATSRGTSNSTNNMFRTIGAGAISPVPPALIAHALFPWSASVPTVGRFYVNTAGERLPVRGGHWSAGSNAGVAALNLNYSRGSAGASVGFRPAFVI
jgi:hypothetical protein